MLRALIVIVLALIAGLAAGRLAAPRYHAPPKADEPRLKQRAVEYYRAGKLFDFDTMAQHFTPARQLSDTAALAKRAKEVEADSKRLPENTRADLKYSAESITSDSIQLRAEGDWAITEGAFGMLIDGKDIQAPLEPLIWCKDSGDWWIFQFTPTELNAYGNPPDFAMRLKGRVTNNLDEEQPGGSPSSTPAATPSTSGNE